MITLTSCAISNKSFLNQNEKTSSSNDDSYKGTTELVLKRIIIDELTREKEAVILYDSMYAVIEEEENIAGGKIIEINSDHIVFEKDGKINLNRDINNTVLENEEVIDGILESLKFDFRTKQTLRNYLADHGIRRPLHCLQLIATAIEAEVIESYGDSFVLKKGTNLNNLPPPNDFVQMVEKELALLDPHLVSVLKCSAIIGRSFRASIVAEIFNINILDFLELLKGAEDRNIIRDVSVEDDIYEFVDKRMLGIFKGLIIKSEDGNEPQIIKEFHKKYITIKLNELANKKITPNELPYRDILSMAAHANAISDVTLDKVTISKNLITLT